MPGRRTPVRGVHGIVEGGLPFPASSPTPTTRGEEGDKGGGSVLFGEGEGGLPAPASTRPPQPTKEGAEEEGAEEEGTEEEGAEEEGTEEGTEVGADTCSGSASGRGGKEKEGLCACAVVPCTCIRTSPPSPPTPPSPASHTRQDVPLGSATTPSACSEFDGPCHLSTIRALRRRRSQCGEAPCVAAPCGCCQRLLTAYNKLGVKELQSRLAARKLAVPHALEKSDLVRALLCSDKALLGTASCCDVFGVTVPIPPPPLWSPPAPRPPTPSTSIRVLCGRLSGACAMGNLTAINAVLAAPEVVDVAAWWVAGGGGAVTHPLVAAAEANQGAVVAKLLGTLLATPDAVGVALLKACALGLDGIVTALLGVGCDRDPEHLFAACAAGHGGVVRLLLGAGYDANAVQGGGGSALWAACKCGQEGAVAALLAGGADVGFTRPSDGASCLWIAAAGGHVAVVEACLAAGACPAAATTGDGLTPLHSAALGGNLRLCRVLKAAGADARQAAGAPCLGLTPLCIAMASGAAAVVQALL